VLLHPVHVLQIHASSHCATQGGLIGQGAQKRVYKAFDERRGIEVAWNEVPVQEMALTTTQDRARIFGEIRVLKALKHKNVMSLYDWWYDNNNQNICFITELFTDGSLRQYRRKHRNADLIVMKRWAWQILQGLVYLHAHNPPIIHRDLKSDNIFVNGSSGTVKIGDLGFATMRAGLSVAMSVIGTPEFMAPELYEESYNEKVDVYSFGMCLLELATLEYPYSECRNAAQIFKKVVSGIPPKGLEKVTCKELHDFIMLCITHDPIARPEARKLLKHPFFEEVRSCAGIGWPRGGVLTPSKSSVQLARPWTTDGVGQPSTTVQPQARSSEHNSVSSNFRSGAVSATDNRSSGCSPEEVAGWPPLPLPFMLDAPLTPIVAAPGRPYGTDPSGCISASLRRQTDSGLTYLPPAALPASPYNDELAGTLFSSIGDLSEQDVLFGKEGTFNSGSPPPSGSQMTLGGRLESQTLSEPLPKLGELSPRSGMSIPGMSPTHMGPSKYVMEDDACLVGGHDDTDAPIVATELASSLPPEQTMRVNMSCRQSTNDNCCLSFSLSFINHDGVHKKVGFQYSLDEDEPGEIAHEMVENLALRMDEAFFISKLIEQQVVEKGGQVQIQVAKEESPES